MTNQNDSIQFDDCFFYHTIDLPGHGVVAGPWDLRGREDRYTGYLDFTDKRVLEIGPASGGLTAYMERQGGTVTCVETSDELVVDILPNYSQDLDAHRDGGRATLKQVRNAWEYTKSALELSATVHIGNVNTLPSQLGEFDIAFVGAILVHCKSPFDIVRQACLAAIHIVSVTDLLVPGMEDTKDSIMRFNPSQGASVIHWWTFSPGAIINMLKLHGFNDCTTIFHEQLASGSLTPMFTVVGRK